MEISNCLNVSTHNMWFVDLFGVIALDLVKRWLSSDSVIERGTMYGNVKDGTTIEAVADLISQEVQTNTDSSRLLKSTFVSRTLINGEKEMILRSRRAVVRLSIAPLCGGTFAMNSQVVGLEEDVATIMTILKTFVVPPKDERNVVKTIMRGSCGLEISTIGVAGRLLERGNYSDEVVTAFDHVVTDIDLEDPCGKLIILDGPPGTGKTFLVRGLIEAGKAEFVFIPSNLVASLSGPEIITCLADERARNLVDSNTRQRPFVLIVEDADECLQERANDNLGSISSLLNMTDGIVGAALDIRVVATTNMDIKKMKQDKALLRDGRLCRRIFVGELSTKQALLVGKRLGVDVDEWQDTNLRSFPVTLAEIYRIAYDVRNGTKEVKPVDAGGSKRPASGFLR